MSKKKTRPATPLAEAVPITEDELIAAIPDLEAAGLLDEAELRVRAIMASEWDSPEGFAQFYYVMMGKDLPAHARRWIEQIYGDHAEGNGTIIKAFRGSTKTTTITMLFTAFRIGKEPATANLLIQVGDDIAEDNTTQIADLIATNPRYKYVFPDTAADIERGWGVGGFEVKQASMDYGEWRRINTDRKDPSFVGLGYKSSAIVGKHPNGVLDLDDIHDEGNTASERELAFVIKILNGTILKTMTKTTWPIVSCTPWVVGDAYDYLAKTGRFGVIETPVFVPDPDGDAEFLGERVRLAWPEVFDIEEIKKQYDLDLTSGKVEFARMYLLDLTKTQHRVFSWQAYPAEKIGYSWPVVCGVDYAGTMDEQKNREGRNDYFAMAYLMKLPDGGAVVYDGKRAHCTQAEAESFVIQAQNMFPLHLTSVVEGDGKGEEFIQVLRRNPGLKIIPMKTGGRGKGPRFEHELQPWLASGRVRISDADTPFLNALRKELADYPHGRTDDCIDSIYWALRGMPDVLSMPSSAQELPSIYGRKKKANPFLSFGSR